MCWPWKLAHQSRRNLWASFRKSSIRSVFWWAPTIPILEKEMLVNHLKFNQTSHILPSQLTWFLVLSGPSQVFDHRTWLPRTAASRLRSPGSGKSTLLFWPISLTDCLTGWLTGVVFSPSQLVKTTGGPMLGASVVSPALTSGAVSLLQKHLTQEEKDLWNTLGPNWTSPWLLSS